MKKILSLLIAVCMIFTLFTNAVAETFVIDAQQGEVADNKFVVSFTTTDSSTGSFRLKYTYPEELKYVGIANSMHASDLKVTNKNSDRTLTIVWSSSTIYDEYLEIDRMACIKDFVDMENGKFKIVDVKFEINKDAVTDDDVVAGKVNVEFSKATGDYNYYFRANDDENMFDSVADTIEIEFDDPRPEITDVTVSANDDLVYTGSEISAKDVVSVDCLETDNVFINCDEEILDAGDYTVNVTVKRDGYKTYTESVDVTVKPAPITEISIGGQQITYTNVEGLNINDCDFKVLPMEAAEFVTLEDFTLDGSSDFMLCGLDVKEYGYRISATPVCSNSNYTLEGVRIENGYFFVKPKPITVKIYNKEMIYGEDVPKFTSDAPVGVKLDYMPITDPDATNYDILATVADDSSKNYDVTIEKGQLIVNKKAAKIMVKDVNQIQGKGKQTFEFIFDGFLENEEPTDVVASLSKPYQDVVGYTSDIVIDSFAANNYDVSTTKGTYNVIDKYPVEVTITAGSKVYGEDDPTIAYTVDEEYENNVLVTRDAGENVGEYAYNVALKNLDESEYKLIVNFASDSDKFVINKKSATISVNDAEKFVDEEDPDFTGTVAGFLNNDAAAVVYSREDGETAGTYKITAAIDNDNYDVTVTDAKLTIKKYDAQITINDLQITVGKLITFVPQPIYSGFKGQDAELITATIKWYNLSDEEIDYADIDTSFSAEYTGKIEYVYNDYIAGKYNITKDEDVKFSVVDKTVLEITGVTVADKVYDAKPAKKSGRAVVSGADYNGDLEYLYVGDDYSSVDAPVNAGEYKLIVSIPESDELYTGILEVPFTISKKEAKITAKDVEQIVGKGKQELTGYTFEGFLAGEEPEVASATLSETYADEVGYTAEIVVGDFVADNYDVTTINGTYTIIDKTAVVIEITAASKVYGDREPSIKYTVDKKYKTNVVVSRAEGEDVGEYDYIVALKNLDESEYKLVVTYKDNNDKFVIDKKSAVIKVKDAEKFVGEEDPDFTGTISGFLNNDASAIVYSREDGESAGTYNITAIFDNDNYDVDIIDGEFTIKKYDAQITINDVQITVAKPLPAMPQPVYTGFKTEDVDLITATIKWYNSSNEEIDYADIDTSLVAEYTGKIEYAYNDYIAEKYDITKDEEVKFSVVDKTVLEISGVKVASKVYNAKPVEKSGRAVVSGANYNGDLEYLYVGDDYSSVDAPVNAGEYKLIVSIPESDELYTGVLEVPFTISPKEATIKVKDAEKFVGEEDPALSGTTTGFLGSDASAIEYSRAQEGEVAGDYIITATLDNDNYAITVTDAKLTIKKYQAKVSVANKSVTVGKDLPEEPKPEFKNFKDTDAELITYTITWKDANGETVVYEDIDTSVKADYNGTIVYAGYETLEYKYDIDFDTDVTFFVRKVSSGSGGSGGYIKPPVKEEDKTDDNKPEDNKPEDNKPDDNKPEDNKPEDSKIDEETLNSLPEVLRGDAVRPNSNNEIVLTVGQKEALAFRTPKVNDVAPMIVKDRVMLPIRFLAETLGAEVGWDGQTNGVVIKFADREISLIVGEAKAIVDGKAVELDVASFIDNSRTYLPIRFITENIGFDVDWEGEAQKVIITKAN